MNPHDPVIVGAILAIVCLCCLRTRRVPKAYVGEVIIHGTIVAGIHPEADNICVYHRDTKVRPQLVHSCNIDEGWIRLYYVHVKTRRLAFSSGPMVTRKIYGNWGLLPRAMRDHEGRRTYATVSYGKKDALFFNTDAICAATVP